MSLEATLACPTYGECSFELDKDTCLFLSRKAQMLFSNEICAELPNGTLYAFKLPAGAKYYFPPPTIFYPHPGHCPMFSHASYGVYWTMKYRNAWLIVGVETESETSSEQIIRLHLQHAVTKQEDMIRYRKTDKKFEPIGNYTVIANYTVMEEVYARNPSKENPLAIMVYLWDNNAPQHEWQHVRTLAEVLPRDQSDAGGYTRPSRAACVFPSLRRLCMLFNERTGECTCHPGFNGTFCEKDINECEQSPCKNGECKNTRGSYYCMCKDGWIGKHCETDVDECNYASICGSRGTCRNTPGSFQCDCITGLTGKHCDYDVEECSLQPIPCEPRGKCIDTFGSYLCHCFPGWTGKKCNDDFNECTSGEQVCFNGGTCTNTVGSYSCACTERWTGPKCREPADLCNQLECVNGLCVQKEDGFHVECKCYVGWSGDSCKIDRDECEEKKDLCSKNGVCSDRSGNYTCTCHVGYTGKNCEKDINECAMANCVNGYCVDLVGGHSCNCYPGWTGERCVDKLSACDYSGYKCVKGTCVSQGKVPRCNCSAGYTGDHCEIKINKCDAEPCVNGLCVDGQRLGEFKCICQEGYGGFDCSIEDNRCIPPPCHNGAPCVINKRLRYGYSCTCKDGYFGNLCEVVLVRPAPAKWYFAKSFPPIAMRTMAYSSWNTCGLVSAFVVVHFVNMSLAATIACPHVGVCSIEIDRDRCLFVSNRPQILFTNEVCSSEHPNGTLYAFKMPAGTKESFYPLHFFYAYPKHCTYFDVPGPVYLKYRNAWLIVGFEHRRGSWNMKYIKLHLKHAITHERDTVEYKFFHDGTLISIGNYSVIANGDVMREILRKGASEERPLAILLKAADIRPKFGEQSVLTFAELEKDDREGARNSGYQLLNRATCEFPSRRKVCMRFNEQTGECTCRPGYSGTFCSTDINECDQTPCKNGYCSNTYGSYHCVCDAGWVGEHCEIDVNECDYPDICGSRGTCRNTPGSFQCDCITGLTGKHCDYDVEECSQQPIPCEPHGKCIETFGSYSCHCFPGWTGKTCNDDFNECTSGEQVCFNGGTCTNTVGSYSCACTERWTGPTCREPADLCNQLECVNGLCVQKEDGFHVECKCYVGWTGDSCKIDRDECKEKKDLCANNGVCADRSGNYTCTCHVGYTGKNCEKDINECAMANCVNGYCVDLVGGHSCNCYPGWTGERCVDKLSACDYSGYKCVKGTCVSQGKVPRCNCSAGYTGDHCEIKINKCELHPCVRGYCVDGKRYGEFSCICQQGYGGFDCSVDDNPCTAGRCHNDAPCVINKTSPYGYTCVCKKGYFGRLCEAHSSAGMSARRNVVQLTIVVLFVLALYERSVASDSWTSLPMPMCLISQK